MRADDLLRYGHRDMDSMRNELKVDIAALNKTIQVMSSDPRLRPMEEMEAALYRASKKFAKVR